MDTPDDTLRDLLVSSAISKVVVGTVDDGVAARSARRAGGQVACSARIGSGSAR